MGFADSAQQAPTELVAQQARLQQLRLQLRGRAEAVGWHSPAAYVFAELLQGLLSLLSRSETHTGELAAAIERHRRVAQRREREISAAAGAVATSVKNVVKLL